MAQITGQGGGAGGGMLPGNTGGYSLVTGPYSLGSFSFRG